MSELRPDIKKEATIQTSEKNIEGRGNNEYNFGVWGALSFWRRLEGGNVREAHCGLILQGMRILSYVQNQEALGTFKQENDRRVLLGGLV